MPKVSVIMGVYNLTDKNILKKSIESILNQTFKDFEFIICDDGSKDNTIGVVKEICGFDKRVIIINNEKNEGLAYTLNKCLENATGEYIARMDADDYSQLDRLEKQVLFLDNNKDYDLVSCCCNVFDETGIYGERVYSSNVKKEDFLFNSPIIHPAIMVRKKSIEKVNGYRNLKKTYRVEDYDMFLRMLVDGQKMYILNEKLFDFRENKESYCRRKYKYRINEMIVRYENFKSLELLPQCIMYVFKPLIVGLIPTYILKRIRNNRRKNEFKNN